MKHDERPPRLLLALFRWLCHPDFREEIEGDLLEKYHADMQKDGLKSARRQFVAEGFSLCNPSLILHLNRNSMTTQHLLSLLLITLLIVTASIAPFLPTPSIHFAHGISTFAQTMGFLGLAFVPFGLIWLITELRNKKDQALNRWTSGYFPSLLAAIPLFALLVIQLVGGISSQIWQHKDFWTIYIPVLLTIVAIIGFCLYKSQKLKRKQTYKFNVAPLFLTLIPLIALLNAQFVVGKVAAISRENAILRTEPLITAIEKFKLEKGNYPDKLEELKGIYISEIPSFSSKGISDYHYQKREDTFQLSFERMWHWNATEVVVYNQSEHERNKFKYDNYETSHANWRYYMAD